MNRKGLVYFGEKLAGRIWQDPTGYYFEYDAAYLHLPDARAISFTLPLSTKRYTDKQLFPFFDGLQCTQKSTHTSQLRYIGQTLQHC
ncbi:MAG: hypothetical protein EOO08_01710 [Chitinophagaceae bacterium]|nr:MAG: hypothetical protein EOO08_01710 [Chitinophagaceae bacterium]